MHKYVFARAMCAGALARVRTWISLAQQTSPSLKCVGREEAEQARPAALSSSRPPWWGPPQAMDTCDTGQNKEAAKLVSCLQKVGSKFSAHPPDLKPN